MRCELSGMRRAMHIPHSPVSPVKSMIIKDTALWFVLDELKMYIACDRVEDTRWCGMER